MAQYDRLKLEGYAREMGLQAVLVCIGQAILYIVYFLAFHFVSTVAKAIIQAISLQKLLHPTAPPAQPENLLPVIVIVGIIGFIVGLAKTQKLRIQAQTIFCQVEQERHLAQIAKLLGEGKWTPQPTLMPPPGTPSNR